MNWIKLDDQFFSHPKVVDLSKDAKLLYLAGLCYCGAQLTDGLITRGGVRIIGAMVEAGVDCTTTELVAAGLWEVVDGGWQVHDYLDYQSSREKAQAVRAVRAEAGSRGGKQSGIARSKNEANGQANGQAKTKQIQIQRADTETESEDAPVREAETATPADDWAAVGYAARHALTPSDDPAVATGERGYRTARGQPFPLDWSLTPERAAWARDHCPHVLAPVTATAKFVAHYRARGERRTAAAWEAEWEKWLLGDEARAVQDAAARGVKAPTVGSSDENPHTREYLNLVEARNARRDARIAERRAAQGVH